MQINRSILISKVSDIGVLWLHSLALAAILHPGILPKTNMTPFFFSLHDSDQDTKACFILQDISLLFDD